ncbi:AAA family ATPase [Saprospira grandis]|uniref:ATPase n=1 Tax=Saprospira grandis (strain Lewin) TaxID=984262 RepID=H6L8P0_SAPGL|nr:AAA family ATPase [Saprospira grandis]AFC26846.1 ATPase [Saprospira grandis str. Lewin]
MRFWSVKVGDELLDLFIEAEFIVYPQKLNELVSKEDFWILIGDYGEAMALAQITGDFIQEFEEAEYFDKLPKLNKYLSTPTRIKIFNPEELFRYKSRYTFEEVSDDSTIKKILELGRESVSISRSALSTLNFLRKEQPSLYFRLRARNTANMLKKGYFFLGDKDNCIISFWMGDDLLAKRPNIYLEITFMGDIKLILSASDNMNKAAFFKKLAVKLGGMQYNSKEGGKGGYWEKEYEVGNFSVWLQSFVDGDKETIDAFLLLEQHKKSPLGNLGFIPQEFFERQLAKVMPYRKSLRYNSFNELIPDSTPSSAPSLPPRKEQHFRLQRLVLENIGHFERLELDLSSRIICLLGHNGSGKSTVLRALALGLVGIDDNPALDLREKEIQRLLRIDTETGTYRLEHPYRGKITVDYELEQDYRNKVEFSKEAGMFFVGAHNSMQIERDSFGLAAGLSQYKHLLLGFPQLQAGSSKDDHEPKKVLAPNFNDVSSLIYNRDQNRYAALGEWIKDLEADSHKNNGHNEGAVLTFIFSLLSKILEQQVELLQVEHQENLIWLQLEGRKVPFHLLSQGFRNVFAWVGRLIRRLYESADYDAEFYEYPAIVLIDEIDTYLHPKWQRKILDALAEEFPRAQFIVSTHSPLVASYLEAHGETAKVYILDSPIGGQEAAKAPREINFTYGRDIADIFLEWMGVKQRDEEVTQEIDAIFALIEEENAESLAEARQRIEALKLPARDADMFKLNFALKLAEEELEN